MGLSEQEKADYAESETDAYYASIADDEWEDTFFEFPWLDCVSTCNFSNPHFMKEFPKVLA